MKSVLISIKPYYCQLIMEGKKTLEFRKNTPHLELPFKCYIYESAGKTFRFGVMSDTIAKYREERYLDTKRGGPIVISVNGAPHFCYGKKKVIGEFTCDYILGQCESANADIAEQQGFVKREKLIEYANGRPLYGWHISDLVIYDVPKELSKFIKPGYKTPEELQDDNELCSYCYETDYGKKASTITPNGPVFCEGVFCKNAFDSYLDENNFFITRPPQSWCYVEAYS